MSGPVHIKLPPLPALLALARSHRLALLAAGGGALLLAVAGRLLRRRRAPPAALPLAASLRYARPQPRPTRPAGSSGADGAGDTASPGAPLRRLRRYSALSSAGSVTSLATIVAAGGGPMQPQQLGMMGMEALEAAVGYWEDALAAYTSDVSGGAAVPSPEEAQFCTQLQRLLDTACRLQAECEQMFLFYESALYRSNTATPVPTSAVSSTRGRTRTATSDCSVDSFHSAEGAVADLSDFDEASELASAAAGLPLYQSALQLYDSDGIPFRTLRTLRCGCDSDVEYLARLHCVRLGYQYLLQQQPARSWLVDSGRTLLTLLMQRAGREPRDIVLAYEAMVEYLAQPEVWPTVKLELQARNVRCFTFFDIVLDYIILDAFDDLESPPSTVIAVMQNRWLTAGFKESALNTAIWSVLKAKRQAMQFANGFKSHFYTLAEHLIPVLAWGLLGPDQQLSASFGFLKDQVSGYVRDIFDPERVRYTCVEDLTEDLYKLSQLRYSNVCQRLQRELEQA